MSLQQSSLAGSPRVADLSERILVVDDEPQIVMLISRLLEREGYQIDAASDGDEALRRLEEIGTQESSYALVISDLRMPGIDGLSLLSAVKDRFPSTMFVLVTGFATLDSAVSALREGAYDFLIKPIDLEHLLSTVHRALEHRSLQLQNQRLIVSLRETADALRRRTISLEQLHREEQRKTEQLRKVNAIARQITTLLDVDQLIAEVIALIAPAFEFDSPSFGLVRGEELYWYGGRLDGQVQPLESSSAWQLTGGGREPFVRDAQVECAKAECPFELIFPVQAGQTSVGFWATDWRPDARYRHENLPYLESLAAQIAAVLENARLYALARRADELAFLNTVSRVANQSLDLEETIRSVVVCMQEALNVPLVELYVADKDGERKSFCGLVHPGCVTAEPPCFPQASWRQSVPQAVVEGEAFWISRPLLSLDFCRQVRLESPLICDAHRFLSTDRNSSVPCQVADALQSVVGVSLHFGDRQIGVLGVGSAVPEAFDKEYGHLLQVVGGQVATAIQNARLFREVESGRLMILESRNTLQTLFDGILDGIYIIDRDNRILAINRTQAERAGKPYQELIGSPAEDACPASAPALQVIAQTFEQGVPLSENERRRGSGGRWSEWEIHTYPILCAGNGRDVDRVVVVVRDVTEQRWLEASLLQSEKLAAVGTLAAGIAHEINNPMTVVSANAQILREEIPDNHPYYGSVELIDRASERASKIVRNLLDFSRSEEFELVPTDLNRSILEALSLVETQFRKAGVETVLDLASDLPHIYASPDHLHVVWLNLLLNARDAIRQVRDQGQIQVSSHLYGKWIAVHISDDGAGIPDEQMNRLFDPFYTTKDPGKGTGLGLFTCYRTVTRHDGEIAVESQKGQGTTFHVLLPLPSE